MPDPRTPRPRGRGDDGRCRIWLGSWICGEGESLQVAADDLVDRLASLARSLRTAGVHSTAGVEEPQRDAVALLWRLGQRVSGHEGEREVVFGTAGPSFSL